MNDQTREIYKDSIEIFQKLKKENQYIYRERESGYKIRGGGKRED